jgi:hypothetical protein
MVDGVTAPSRRVFFVETIPHRDFPVTASLEPELLHRIEHSAYNLSRDKLGLINELDT